MRSRVAELQRLLRWRTPQYPILRAVDESSCPERMPSSQGRMLESGLDGGKQQMPAKRQKAQRDCETDPKECLSGWLQLAGGVLSLERPCEGELM
jgi:hypothetical protein